MKEQDKTPEKQPNEKEIGSLPEKEFKIMIVKMIQGLGKRREAKTEKMQKMFKKDMEGERADSRSKKNYNPAACVTKTTFTER